MRHGSLFSGIGGFDLAAEWMGWDNIFHCEINSFCQKVLKYHFPDSESLTDIKTTDFKKYNGSIDIISGGFPCQPYSVAGKRKGKEDERHLWPEMLRAIREIRPRWVVGENVFGLVNWSGGLVFHEVQTDLEAEGYEVFPYVLPACAKDAPHRRDRVWFVAYAVSNDAARQNRESFIIKRKRTAITKPINGRQWETIQYKRFYDISQHYSNANNERLQRREVNKSFTGIRQDKNEQLTGLFQSALDKFPTQSPLCGRNDGVPDRVDRIKALGNAIVPQVAFEIFKAIEATENFFTS